MSGSLEIAIKYVKLHEKSACIEPERSMEVKGMEIGE